MWPLQASSPPTRNGTTVGAFVLCVDAAVLRLLSLQLRLSSPPVPSSVSFARRSACVALASHVALAPPPPAAASENSRRTASTSFAPTGLAAPSANASLPSLSFAPRSAPPCSSLRTHSALPLAAASSSGVQPLTRRTSVLAPAASSRDTVLVHPHFAASPRPAHQHFTCVLASLTCHCIESISIMGSQKRMADGTHRTDPASWSFC